MISTPTVFVVGAGASRPYGLPLASELLQEAQVFAKKRSEPLYDLLRAVHAGTDVDDCLDSVSKYPGPSLDRFLENQPQHREVGHALIAGLMALRIQQTRETPQGEWLSYLIERMRTAAWPQFVGNRVTFITFNFDNVVEDVLVDEISRTYPGPISASEILKAVPIIHVHGVLPAIHTLDANWLTQAGSAVRVIHDELDPDDVERAKVALQAAHVVCFLGLGYHPENLTTLFVRHTLNNERIECFGSAKGLLDGERFVVEQRFPRHITLGQPGQTCLDVLRSYRILRTD